jgi:hypothetical protein
MFSSVHLLWGFELKISRFRRYFNRSVQSLKNLSGSVDIPKLSKRLVAHKEMGTLQEVGLFFPP